MKTLKFSNKDEMPAFGLGTWKSAPGEVKSAVITAIKTGYRHIDCAPIYGNEKEVGEGIKACIDEGIIKREELWITSKLWNDSHKREDIAPAIRATLADLQLDYLDLYLIHWPVAFRKGVGFPENGDEFLSLEEAPLLETWKGMEEINNAGLCRHIGVSNFSRQKLDYLISHGETKPEMNQVELHPYLQQQALVDFCHENDVHVTAYSPLGSLDRPERLKNEGERLPIDNRLIHDLAEKYNRTSAQILIAWALHRKTAVIPKSTNDHRIKENFEAQEIELSSDDMENISKLERKERLIDGSLFVTSDNSYTIENIWDE
ncbi:MAG: aldo/keto reductase [Fulvivirga sp.]|nr:aldo/keto reductase [Fulvivirga sp.]